MIRSLNDRHRLRLKTIVSMIPEKAPPEVVDFCQQEGIEHIHIDTEEYDIDCIPSSDEKKRVISVCNEFSLLSSYSSIAPVTLSTFMEI